MNRNLQGIPGWPQDMLASRDPERVDSKGNSVDGFLAAREVYNLKLPAEMVVLSACQTALGKEIKGEGLVGLTRGFMYAGAPRVIASLWNVNDPATADLMTMLYTGILKEGKRPAAALREAQLEMWKQKKYQAPFYWAAFELQGAAAQQADWRPFGRGEDTRKHW